MQQAQRELYVMVFILSMATIGVFVYMSFYFISSDLTTPRNWIRELYEKMKTYIQEKRK